MHATHERPDDTADLDSPNIERTSRDAVQRARIGATRECREDSNESALHRMANPSPNMHVSKVTRASPGPVRLPRVSCHGDEPRRRGRVLRPLCRRSTPPGAVPRGVTHTSVAGVGLAEPWRCRVSLARISSPAGESPAGPRSSGQPVARTQALTPDPTSGPELGSGAGRLQDAATTSASALDRADGGELLVSSPGEGRPRDAYAHGTVPRATGA
ncbi:hypothetical protein JHW43_002056 [Diplocarpon mali]|nr:hypothetical protein JHW43_002056 [Diplocarpon mali]